MNNTREYIINQSYSLFLSHSYEAVSISEISKAIGLTKGALYHHFTNKEELFKAVIDKYLVFEEIHVDESRITLAEYVEKSIDHAQRIMNSILTSSQNSAPLNYLSLFIDALRHYPAYFVEKGNLISHEIEKIKKVIKNAIQTKEIRDDINVSITALNFFSIIYGFAGNLVQSNSKETSLEMLRLQLNEMYRTLKL